MSEKGWRGLGHRLGPGTPPRGREGQEIYEERDRIDWLSSRLPGPVQVLMNAPVIGDITGVLTLAEEAVNIGRVFSKDPLRMQGEYKTKSDWEKEDYLKRYILSDFDRVNRVAKLAYHNRRMIRMVVSTAIDAAAVVGTIWTGSHMGEFTHLTHLLSQAPILNELPKSVFSALPNALNFHDGLGKDIIRDYFIFDGAKNALLGVREGNESVHLLGRSGRRGRYYPDRPIQRKIARAVEFLGIEDPTTAARVYRDIEAERRARHDAFVRLKQQGKLKNVRKIARKLEFADWKMENPGRPVALLNRLQLLPPFLQGRKKMTEKRMAIRERGYHFDGVNYVPGE